ncbi:DUF4333 domain-containing protein [Labedella populi]|uniref:DUF4333 domain-containing protein n=1 Tax=Labedella populi TaxID=2498850 RepID=A0A444Q5W0_9MICO|nr:DUF4333 domain-containing protein [Labedella populi]RWZ59233.1 DUF4333 domain-containing protein [Labedella populi]
MSDGRTPTGPEGQQPDRAGAENPPLHSPQPAQPGQPTQQGQQGLPTQQVPPHQHGYGQQQWWNQQPNGGASPPPRDQPDRYPGSAVPPQRYPTPTAPTQPFGAPVPPAARQPGQPGQPGQGHPVQYAAGPGQQHAASPGFGPYSQHGGAAGAGSPGDAPRTRRRFSWGAASLGLLAGAAVGALITLAVTGQFVRPVFTGASVEDGVQGVLEDEFGLPDVDDVSCPEEPSAAAGAEFACAFTTGDREFSVQVRVLDSGGQYLVGAVTSGD